MMLWSRSDRATDFVHLLWWTAPIRFLVEDGTEKLVEEHIVATAMRAVFSVHLPSWKLLLSSRVLFVSQVTVGFDQSFVIFLLNLV